MDALKRLMAIALIFSTTAMGLPLTAQAAMVTTEESLSIAPAESGQRERVRTFLMRDDVRKALHGQGISEQSAIDRVNAMTDTEVAQLADRVDQAPAGGDVLGLIFTVFIVLLVTDILGLTKVFPFTRSVR